MTKAILAALLLCGCATTETYWVKPGASSSEFYQDRGQCQAQAFSYTPYLNTRTVMIFQSCMSGKGWYQEQASR